MRGWWGGVGDLGHHNLEPAAATWAGCSTAEQQSADQGGFFKVSGERVFPEAMKIYPPPRSFECISCVFVQGNHWMQDLLAFAELAH